MIIQALRTAFSKSCSCGNTNTFFFLCCKYYFMYQIWTSMIVINRESELYKVLSFFLFRTSFSPILNLRYSVSGGDTELVHNARSRIR
jgi:hypothetical protein